MTLWERFTNYLVFVLFLGILVHTGYHTVITIMLQYEGQKCKHLKLCQENDQSSAGL